MEMYECKCSLKKQEKIDHELRDQIAYRKNNKTRFMDENAGNFGQGIGKMLYIGSLG